MEFALRQAAAWLGRCLGADVIVAFSALSVSTLVGASTSAICWMTWTTSARLPPRSELCMLVPLEPELEPEPEPEPGYWAGTGGGTLSGALSGLFTFGAFGIGTAAPTSTVALRRYERTIRVRMRSRPVRFLETWMSGHV